MIQPAFRFAPSPNGRLHLGHAYSALLNADFAARWAAGSCCASRTSTSPAAGPSFEAAIREDLAWLGLTWETPVRRQSEHFDDYRAAAERDCARAASLSLLLLAQGPRRRGRPARGAGRPRPGRATRTARPSIPGPAAPCPRPRSSDGSRPARALPGGSPSTGRCRHAPGPYRVRRLRPDGKTTGSAEPGPSAGATR